MPMKKDFLQAGQKCQDAKSPKYKSKGTRTEEKRDTQALALSSVLIAQSCLLTRQMPAFPALGLLIVRDRGR